MFMSHPWCFLKFEMLIKLYLHFSQRWRIKQNHLMNTFNMKLQLIRDLFIGVTFLTFFCLYYMYLFHKAEAWSMYIFEVELRVLRGFVDGTTFLTFEMLKWKHFHDSTKQKEVDKRVCMSEYALSPFMYTFKV